MIGLIAIPIQLALGMLYVGLTVLVVPRPEFFAFWAAWVVGVVLVIVFVARRSWVALLVPALSLAAFVVVMWIGERSLGWGP